MPGWSKTGWLAGALAAAALQSVGVARAETLYVAPGAGAGGACTSASPCRTIARALGRAVRGDTISVAHGTYREEVRVLTDVRLRGLGSPIIDAKGRANGVLIIGAGAAGAVVEGFQVRGATFEGILASSTSNVTIARNTVIDDDAGLHAARPSGECAAGASASPLYCGEGIHLRSVTGSAVVANVLQGDSGGILLTDELGPAALNLISRNRALEDAPGSGITLEGRNGGAVLGGVPQPHRAGVYDDYVAGNLCEDDGGAGLLLSASGPGMGAYGNQIISNTANKDGLAGITLHSPTGGQDLDGNLFIGNDLEDDALHGNAGAAGDGAYAVASTIGILVASSLTPLTGTLIAENAIDRVHYGIWTENVPAMQQSENPFDYALVPLLQS